MVPGFVQHHTLATLECAVTFIQQLIINKKMEAAGVAGP